MLQPVRLVSSEQVLADSLERQAQHAWGLLRCFGGGEKTGPVAVLSRVVS